MNKYKTVYPLFECKILELKSIVVKELELKNHTKEARLVFNIILELIDSFLDLLFRKPSLSLENLGAVINANYLLAKKSDYDGLMLFIYFKVDPNPSRLIKDEFNCV